eukprot:GHVN01026133.1.p2 GENE.GHVN01026133.1~~GHVN01026133.1.p2  ORF type:complete len:108 (+),score=13.25 GHVN01026133.1:361-684(+)
MGSVPAPLQRDLVRRGRRGLLPNYCKLRGNYLRGARLGGGPEVVPILTPREGSGRKSVVTCSGTLCLPGRAEPDEQRSEIPEAVQAKGRQVAIANVKLVDSLLSSLP